MSNKKQTAVECLQEKYKQQGTIFKSQFEQAKEMEKQQIINAFRNGYLCHSKKGEQYYNETYKNE